MSAWASAVGSLPIRAAGTAASAQAVAALVAPLRGLFAAQLAGPARPSSSPLPDELLVREAVGGDRRAFDELYRRHVDRVWRRLTYLLGPDPEREDLTQQIFLDVFRGLARFRGDAAFSTFLHRVVVNTACDHLGRRKRRAQPLAPEIAEAVIDPAASPEVRAEERQRLALTFELLGRIKPKKRIAFVLRVVEGLSLEEVAGLVEANVPTVAQRVRHAHEELQDMIARRRGSS